MHHHLPTAGADGVNDAGALFGACHLRSGGIVSIREYSYSWEEGKGGGKGEEEEQGRAEEEPTLSIWRKMFARWSALLMMRSSVRRGGGGKVLRFCRARQERHVRNVCNRADS
jgi:hypothetical protein